MNRVTAWLGVALAFAAGVTLGGFVLYTSALALVLAAVAAVVLALAIGVVAEYDYRTIGERERRERDRMRRLHSEHPLSQRYGGSDRFDVY